MDNNQLGRYRFWSNYFIRSMAIVFVVLGSAVQCQILNQPPHFIVGSGDMARFSLSENTRVGSPVYQLRGVDPEGSKIKYSISGPIFSVDRDTGVVRLRQELDRETQNLIEVIISITDEGLLGTEPNTISLRREIPIRDYNDNHPTFLGRPYTLSISEATKVGAEVTVSPDIIVIDRDEGANAEIQLRCHQDNKSANNVCDTFAVTAEKLTDGNYTAKVRLTKLLDFEGRPSYIMTIAATDGAVENQLTSFATISINVIDVQDQPPVFLNSPYSATVEENTPPDQSILTIKAIDADIGIPRPIDLSLENEIFGHFVLQPIGDPMEGRAILKTTNISLDRENPEILQNGGVYVFSVRATEMINGEVPSDSSITRVTIVVVDVDDHHPEFNGETFNISIPENLGNGMPLPGLSVFVNDKDMGDNSRYQLSLRSVKNADQTFAVTPTIAFGRTPVVVKILDQSKLDYDVDDAELRHFEFDLVASIDGTEKSSAKVVGNLIDANDNSPIFDHNLYRFAIEENRPTNSQIGEIIAKDRDSGEFGSVRYILKGFGSDNFYTNPTSGGIFILKPLDYEKQSSYSLTIVAVDGGDRETNANLFVDVIDVNDNSPMFESKEYTRTIREGTLSFEPQFMVRAYDIDGPTQGGGKVSYAIVSENSISGNVFSINELTGEITLKKVARSMDTERGEYELVVSATDYGTPSLTNTTQVLVRVGISGNQRPIFKGHFQNIENVPVVGPPSYRVSIPENAISGFNVTTVSAHDPDGLDFLLRYRIVGANDNFEINEQSGVITVSPQARLDRDSNMDSFEIVVNAVDSGTPIPETATTTVYVNIKDINDEPPKFEQSNYVGYASERTNVGETVLKVRAFDKDLNSKLEYKIKGPVRATTKAGVSITARSNYNANDAFKIASSTGEISVNGKLRHDVAAVLLLTVEVRDLNAEVDPDNQIDTTEVTIYIQSFKDTNPIFKNKGWTSSKPVVNVNIKEEMPIASTLFTLIAEDPGSELPISSYELADRQELEYFQLHDRTGEILLKSRLDYEALGRGNVFEFQVRATSQDGQRTTITKVNVTVENVNDNMPIFEETSYHATVIENKPHPEKVIQVTATDNDAAITDRDDRLGYHKIIYSLQGENSALFEINNTTGEIRIAPNQTIDRERNANIRLLVKAEDSPGMPTEAKQTVVDLVIDVLDVNDNSPEFTQRNYTAVIPENAPIDSFVLKVSAHDMDEGLGGEIRYDIVNEGEVNGLFKINSVNGEMKTKRALTGKGRSEPYEVVVRAQDNGGQIQKQESLSTDVNIVIYIGDVSANDGIPYIISPRNGQTANISENSPAGSPVFQVIANDPDTPNTPSGTLFYKIHKDTTESEAFDIDESNGLITTLQPLDREIKDLYSIILEVLDNGQPRQSITRILQIKVLDVDDHEPRFAREVDEGPTEYSVLEEEPEGTVVARFSAMDEDVGENSAIDYVIIEGNNENIFAIDRTNQSEAIITTKRAIDRETVDSYLLTVKCFKLGKVSNIYIGDAYNRYDYSHIQILIKIIDIDDNIPEFERRDPSIGIRINVPIDTVITTMHAVDRDAEAPPIILTIENVTFVPQFYKRTRNSFNNELLHNLFTLNNQTGELRTGGSFANYVDGYFQMRIRANNSIKAKRHAFNNLKIFVIRDKSLLKFVFARPPLEIQSIIQPFQEQLQQKLKPLNLELHILDTQVLTRADFSLDFTATSSCFQMFKNGVAIPLLEMQKLMNSDLLKQELFDIYVEYGVSQVESCSVRRTVAAASMIATPGPWLVIIAGLVGIGAIVATCTAFCLKKKYKQHSKRQNLPIPRPQPEPFGVGVPAVFYSEPIYGPL